MPKKPIFLHVRLERGLGLLYTVELFGEYICVTIVSAIVVVICNGCLVYLMKVDNRYCKAFISDLKSCSYWNNSIGYMSDADYRTTVEALKVLEEVYEKMPDEVKSSDHRETPTSMP